MSKPRGPYRVDPLGHKKSQQALDKMAENARELGLDYEPVAPVRENWGPGPHEYHSLTASVQEPVAWLELLREARDNCKASIAEDGISAMRKEYRVDLERRLTAALTTPPAQRQWVGLTQQDIDIAFDDTQEGGGFNEFARAIEAKLKEKNT